MRRVVYSVAMSLDGFIAGKHDEYDWIPMDPEINFSAFMARFDAMIMGRRSFEVVSASPEGSLPEMSTYVASSTLEPGSYRGATVLERPLGEGVRRLRASPGKSIWLFGGGKLFQSMLRANLVDRVEVAVIPILLGDGIPMLPGTGDMQKLKLVDSQTFKATGTVLLSYDIVVD